MHHTARSVGLAADQVGGLAHLIIGGSRRYLSVPRRLRGDADAFGARACGGIGTEVRGSKGVKGRFQEMESEGSICDSPVVVHGAPSRIDRFWAFSAYSVGCFVIFMSALSAPGHEH